MARILVIDDDVQLRKMLRQMLEKEEHEVLDAVNGAMGLELLQENTVDLVITDIFMPVADGISTIMEVYQKFPQVKIIAISGGGRLSSINFLKLAHDVGAHRIFQKPLDRKELLQAVQDLL